MDEPGGTELEWINVGGSYELVNKNGDVIAVVEPAEDGTWTWDGHTIVDYGKAPTRNIAMDYAEESLRSH